MSDDRCGFDRIGDALTVILVHHYGQQGEYVVADCDRVVSIWWHRKYYYGNLPSFYGNLRGVSILPTDSILAFGLFVVMMGNTLLFVGQQYTTAATAPVIFSFTPIFAPIFALWLLPDERLT